jgi:hypothetical protein
MVLPDLNRTPPGVPEEAEEGSIITEEDEA